MFERVGVTALSGVLRVYLRYHQDPVEILHGVEAYPATFRSGAGEYLSVQSDAKDVIAVVPIEIVVGWIYEPEPDTFTPRTRVQVRGYSNPVDIGTFARPVVKGEDYAAIDGWTPFRDLGGRIVAWFRDDLLIAWQFIGGTPQER